MDKPTTEPVREASAGARLHPHDRRRRRQGRQERRPRRDALSARAERLPAHRARQVDLPQLRRRRRSSAAPATSASTTPTRPRKTSSTSTRFRRTSAGSASPGTTGRSTRPTTSSSSTSTRSTLIRNGLAYVDSLTADEIRAHRGTLTEPGTPSPYRDRPVDENLDLFARMRAGEFRGRRARAAREDRHGVAEHQHARSRALPHPPRAPSPDRRRLVHLSDVRLRASAVGRARAHHALALHARVRGSSAALRLADRATCRCRRSRARSSSRG